MAYKFSAGDFTLGVGAVSMTGDLSSSADLHVAHGGYFSGSTVNTGDGLHVCAGINVGPAAISGKNTTVGVISGSAAATLYGLTTYDIAAQTISASSTANLVGPTNLGKGNQTTISNVGLLSSSATATMYALTADRITVGDLAAVTLHGDGALLQNLTASAGPSTSTNVVQAVDFSGILSGGMNYFTASTNPISVRLPSGTIGDIVHVKASSGVTNINYIKITMSIALTSERGTIDGAPEALIESPYGSVSLCYVKDSAWRIF